MPQSNISLSFGINRTPSLGHDGELSECVNLIPRAGELVNIDPPTAMSITLPTSVTIESTEYNFTEVLLREVHHIQADQSTNYIYEGKTLNGSYLVYYRNGSATLVTTSTFLGITQILIVGNTLILLGENLTRYYLWKNNAYIDLGSDIPAVTLQFGLQTETKDIKDNFAPSSPWVLPTYAEWADLPTTHTIDLTAWDAKSELSMLAHGLRNQAIDEIHEENKFALPFFVRYALRLFDGSLVNWSPLVLMTPNTVPACFVSDVNNFNPSGSQSLDNTSPGYCIVHCKLDKATLDYALVQNPNELDPRENWSDIIKEVAVFVSAPLYLYDTNKDANSINLGNYITGPTVIDYYKNFYHVPLVRISKQNDESYYRYARNNKMTYLTTDWTYNPGEQQLVEEQIQAFIALPAKSEAEIKRAVEEESNFYKVAEIKLGDLSTTREEVPIPEHVVSTLLGQETMDNATSNADTYTFKQGFAYNGRAVLFNAIHKRGLTRYTPAVHIPFTNKPTTSPVPSGAVNTGILKLAFNVQSQYGDGIVDSNRTANTDWNTPAFFYLFATDDEAKDMYADWNRYTTAYNHLYGEFSLTQHKLLKGAYWFNLFEDVKDDLTASSYPVSSGAQTFAEPNRLFISDVLNPFLLRETNTVTLDVGDIRAVSTVTQALSQGQFGQFPLYAFTDDGIWALEISSTGTISAKQPVSRDVITPGTQPLQTDNAVIFITAQGLKLIEGSQTALLSEPVEGFNPDDTKYRIANRSDYADLNALLAASDTQDFVAQLQTARLLYDYTYGLIHIYIGLTKHYVYSLSTRQWSTQYLKIGDIAATVPAGFPAESTTDSPLPDPAAIIPAYPLSILQYGQALYQYSRVTSSALRPGVALTRPIAFDSPTVMKALMDFRIIGQRTNQNTFRRMAVYVSNDGYRWHQLQSLKRGSFKYYRFLLLSRMTDHDTLSGITVNYQLRRTLRLR